MRKKNINKNNLNNIGNFTKNAVKSFEHAIVDEDNYLEKTNSKINNTYNGTF